MKLTTPEEKCCEFQADAEILLQSGNCVNKLLVVYLYMAGTSNISELHNRMSVIVGTNVSNNEIYKINKK